MFAVLGHAFNIGIPQSFALLRQVFSGYPVLAARDRNRSVALAAQKLSRVPALFQYISLDKFDKKVVSDSHHTDSHCAKPGSDARRTLRNLES